MTKHPLLSIAIITYNQEKFIEKAIESVLAQDYPNIEIIISDDASTDNTLKIIGKYVKTYPNKIKLLKAQKNLGAVANWFKCVTACNGKYIIGLAGDDEFYPNTISKQVAIMESNSDIAICYANANIVDTSTQKTLHRLGDKTPTKSGDIKVALSDAIYYSPTLMFRQEFLPKENSFIGLKHGADLAFYKELMIIAGDNAKINYLDEIIYKYQKHDTNITVTQTEYRKDHIYAIQILQKKYPKYSSALNGSICDFCCVALFKSLKNLNFNDACFFWINGLKASNGNLLKLTRAFKWGVDFYFKKIFDK